MIRTQMYSERTRSFPVQSNHCLTCSNNRVTVEVASVVLQLQGFINSAEERQKILQVMCQLLRVQWETVAKGMTLDDSKAHFCVTCFKVMTTIILLREKMFQIENEIRNELTKIEESVAMSWTESGHTLEGLEACPGINEDVRTTFQRQVMQEICNKELLQQKVVELHQSSSSVSVEVKLSMVQLSLEKNIFKIGANFKKEELIDMHMTSSAAADTKDTVDGDKDWIPPYSSVCDIDPNFSLVAVSSCVTDSDSEVCPSKKAKSPDDVATTLTTDVIENIVEQPSFISSSSKSPPKKCASFFSTNKISTVNSTPSVKPLNRASRVVKSKSPRTPTKRQRSKPTTASSKTKRKNETKSTPTHKNPTIIPNLIETEFDAAEDNANEDSIFGDEPISASASKTKRKNETKSTPKHKKPTIIPNLIETEFDTTEDNANEDFIFGDATISEEDDSETNSEDDSDRSTDDDDTLINSDDEQANEGKSAPMGSMSVDSTSCSRQLFKPKFSRTSITKKEQASIKLEQPEATFIAKDKSTWTTEEPKDSQVVRDYEVLRENGGLIGPAQNTKLTPAELFKLMFPLSIVEKIVNYTNKHAAHEEPKKTRDPKSFSWSPMTVDEMYGYIGILLHAGVEKKRHVHYPEFWNSDEKYAMPAIVATMSRHRFSMIQTYLRFDDTQARKSGPITENENDTSSKRSYISDLLDPFVEVMESHLNPYGTLVLDEMLVRFYGHSKFRVYMKSKPGKYGMKFWAVCDVETGYILKIALYHGKVGDTVAKELGKTVVLDLVKKYFNSGRAVTMDNFFTSKSLGKELMKNKMSMLGTLNRNRMDVIPEFVDHRKREMESSIFAFQGDFTMVSYMQRKNQAAILLSTKHHSAEICPDTKNKPRMILDYNATKSGIDTADLMIATYSCQRATRRWPVKVFYALLDIAAFNAYAVQQHHVSLDKEKVVMDRRQFLRTISEQLMEPLIANRLRTSHQIRMGGPLYRALLRMGYEKQIKMPESDPMSTSESMCSKCKSLESNDTSGKTRRKRGKGIGKCILCKEAGKRSTAQKKTDTRCFVCSRWICDSHSAVKYWCMTDGVECHKG